MCLSQGHNAVTPVMLEPAALWSRVKHSTTGLPISAFMDATFFPMTVAVSKRSKTV